MLVTAEPWDYLILTAANQAQAEEYQRQLDIREKLHLLGNVREWLVVADPEGKRVGSGGSTIWCLLEVLNRELSADPRRVGQPAAWADVLRRLRILIIHAGGDARRLPAYGPCGKIFMPLPGRCESALGVTLFDRQLPIYAGLPPPASPVGQVVITAGDVLLEFSPQDVDLASNGLTGVACSATPELAAKHGVYCLGAGGSVRRFLQKPSPAEQRQQGAVDNYGRSTLDVGVFSFDADVALTLLELCGVSEGPAGRLSWQGPIAEGILGHGLDFYREICSRWAPIPLRRPTGQRPVRPGRSGRRPCWIAATTPSANCTVRHGSSRTANSSISAPRARSLPAANKWLARSPDSSVRRRG